jgi:pimeloyl-ACP methyl ester carboxylesterase
MPGFGSQEPPEVPWGVGDYVDWVIKQVNEKGWDSFVLCGFSFGGRVALKLSAGLKHPLGVKARFLQTMGKTGKAFFGLPLLSTLQPTVHKAWRTILRRKDYYRASGVMQKTFVKVVAEDLREIVTAISNPTLIIWGKKDQFVPVSDAYFLKDTIKEAQLKLLSQGDHYVPYNYPDEIADEIDAFIRGIEVE